MKILLIGEYSNVHWTLAEGLRELGHDVTVVSDGDIWKGYHRDINLKRASLGKIDTLKYLWQIHQLWPTLKGYDVVQIINPIFLDLKAERMLKYYKRLRNQNGKMVLGAFGVDYYWVSEGLKKDTFRYSDFFINGERRNNHFVEEMVKDWMKGEKGRLNQFIADDCDAIVSGLYEYDVCYRPNFPTKTTFIPFPINCHDAHYVKPWTEGEKVRIFIGIQKTRNTYKGTHILLKALNKLLEKYPERVEVIKAVSVPFYEYQELMNSSHVLVDQLYSYTPAMNALNAMAKGLVVVGGGEEEQYAILSEQTLRPIINVLPSLEDSINKIEQLILHPEVLPKLSCDSIEYIHKHHDHIKIAKKYEKLYLSLF